MRAVTAVAVNATPILKPGVGESRISNNVGSGRANVAARRLLNHVSILSNKIEYANVELEPMLDGFGTRCTFPYSPDSFLDPYRVEDGLHTSCITR